MPTNIKIGLSVLTLVVGTLICLWEVDQGNEGLSLIVLGLSGFMVLAMWIFPETGRTEKNRDKSGKKL